MKLQRSLLALMALVCIGAAADPAERLADPAQEARARAIFQQVRCLVCQNESIDDSEADLARDLRRIVRAQLAAGRTDAQVEGFLTDRYGEFVLLKPRFSAWNLALWAGPFAAALAGLALLWLRLRARPPEPELSPDEAEALRAAAEEA